MSNNFEKVNVTTKEYLDMLYDNSALTLVGLAEESIPDLLDWIKEITPIKEEKVFVISGEVMNNCYELTGNNAYSDDLTIISIPLDYIENPTKLVIPRFEIGARWFDDIVDNNLSRESY